MWKVYRDVFVGLVILLLWAETSSAQHVRNIVAQSSDGSLEVEIRYDLLGPPESRYTVQIEAQLWDENRQIAALLPERVFGHVGDGISPGAKTIKWLYGSEKPRGDQEVRFFVEAFPPRWFAYASGFMSLRRDSSFNGVLGGTLGLGRSLNNWMAIDSAVVFPNPYFDTNFFNVWHQEILVEGALRFSPDLYERVHPFVRGGAAIATVTLSDAYRTSQRRHAGIVGGLGVGIGLTRNLSAEIGYNIHWFRSGGPALEAYDAVGAFRPHVGVKLAF
jgi:hypothetical protein